MDRSLDGVASALDASKGIPTLLLDALFASRYTPEATHDAEAKELCCRYMATIKRCSIGTLLVQFGGPTAREALAKTLVQEFRVTFSGADRTHRCEGRNDSAYWKLQRIDRMRYREDANEKVISSSVAKLAEERHLEDQAKAGCNFEHFSPGEHFTALNDGRLYIASGDVFLCTASGRAHICTQEQCDRSVALARDEGLVCELTRRFYRALSVHREANNGGMRERRDGGVTFVDSASSRGRGAGAASRGWQPTRTKSHRDGFRQRRLSHLTRLDASAAAARAADPMCRLYYDSTDDMVISVVERTMRTYYPQADHPQATNELRMIVRDAFKTLTGEGTKIIRRAQWQRIAEAEARASASVRTYVRDQVNRGKRPSPLHITSLCATALRPAFERFEAIGISEVGSEPSRELIMYIEDCVIALWIMLHYTPFAKRYQKGIPLAKHAVGLIYKLQSGYYIARRNGTTATTKAQAKPGEKRAHEEGEESDKADTEFISLVPRHPILENLPQKNDLNKHSFFKERAGYSSASVMDTERLVGQCFASLLDGTRPAEEILRFLLAKYIRLWDEDPEDAAADESSSSDGGSASEREAEAGAPEADRNRAGRAKMSAAEPLQRPR